MPPELMTKAIETAPSVGLGFFLLWVVSNKLCKSQEAHMDLYKDRVNALEKHAEDCDKDREILHNKHAALQANVIDKLSEIVKNK